MSEEQLKGFLEAVAADAELQEKLKAATDVEAVVAIAEAAGFVVSAEELEALVLQAQSEISEEELQGVAGGLDGLQAPGSVSRFWDAGGIVLDKLQITIPHTP